LKKNKKSARIPLKKPKMISFNSLRKSASRARANFEKRKKLMACRMRPKQSSPKKKSRRTDVKRPRFTKPGGKSDEKHEILLQNYNIIPF
jgi:hypothetical protein